MLKNNVRGKTGPFARPSFLRIFQEHARKARKRYYRLILCFCLFYIFISIVLQADAQGTTCLNTVTYFYIQRTTCTTFHCRDPWITCLVDAANVWNTVLGQMFVFIYMDEGDWPQIDWKSTITRHSISGVARTYRAARYVSLECWSVGDIDIVFTDTDIPVDTCYNVALHELGHSLGLQHNDRVQSIMNFSVPVDENNVILTTQKRQLSPMDINLARIYTGY